MEKKKKKKNIYIFFWEGAKKIVKRTVRIRSNTVTYIMNRVFLVSKLSILHVCVFAAVVMSLTPSSLMQPLRMSNTETGEMIQIISADPSGNITVGG